jgi:zinc protease
MTRRCFTMFAPAALALGAGIDRKSRAPLSNRAVAAALPVPLKARLANGVTMLLIEDAHAPLASMQWLVQGAGALAEPDESPGAAAAAAALLMESLSAPLEALGAQATINVSSESPDVQISASGLSCAFDQWMKTLAYGILAPAFSPAAVAQYKTRKQSSLQLQRASTQQAALEAFSRAVYGSFGAARVAPRPESLAALNPAAPAQWHQRAYVPQNTLLAVSAGMPPAMLLSKLKAVLENWRPETAPTRVSSSAELVPYTKRRILLVPRNGALQASFMLGNIGIARRDPDYCAVALLSHLLGGSGVSRLFLKLREEKGYAYDVYSQFQAADYRGAWRIAFDARNEVGGEVLAAVLSELRNVVETPPPVHEMSLAKQAMAARFALSLEQEGRSLQYLLSAQRYGLGEDYWRRYLLDLQNITGEDIQRVAIKYFNPDQVQIVAAGDLQALRPALQKFGEVEVIEQD